MYAACYWHYFSYCSEDSNTKQQYYFNLETGESSWVHPCDAIYAKVNIDFNRLINTLTPSPQKVEEELAKKANRAKGVTRVLCWVRV